MAEQILSPRHDDLKSAYDASVDPTEARWTIGSGKCKSRPARQPRADTKHLCTGGLHLARAARGKESLDPPPYAKRCVTRVLYTPAMGDRQRRHPAGLVTMAISARCCRAGTRVSSDPSAARLVSSV
ncbi:MAG: hypothetical protein ACLQIB_16895 [Isosphaeraceae bacterium]